MVGVGRGVVAGVGASVSAATICRGANVAGAMSEHAASRLTSAPSPMGVAARCDRRAMAGMGGARLGALLEPDPGR
jgi:hypothetical protein